MFKKAKRANLRRRNDSDDEEQEESLRPPLGADSVWGPLWAEVPFLEDEQHESEVFRVKKSNHSKKIVKQLKREYKEDLEKCGTVKHEIRSVAIAIKEEITSRAGSEQGEEEMEVDSADEQDNEAKGQ
ncbi:unnamed protein product, partial [Lampetra planeri]